MSKKSDSYYFQTFVECVEYSCQAAAMLEENLENFDPVKLEERLAQLHGIEHAADKRKHEMMEALVREFITPIEREDIMALSQTIDDVTDKIEDVLIRVYINNIQTIRPEAIQFVKVIIRCCQALKTVMEEFRDFKKSKELHKSLVQINTLEEEGDKLFIASMRKLHVEEKDPMDVIAWREVFRYLEKCCDACEHVADVVESVIMKNT